MKKSSSNIGTRPIGRALFALSVAAMMILPGCKPTEKNYKEAYDIAKLKKDVQDADDMLPTEGFVREGTSVPRVINGDTIYVRSETIRMEDGSKIPESYRLAVGVFKMNTNAKSGAETLKEEGYNAFYVKGEEGRYYTIAAVSDTLQTIIQAEKSFRRDHPRYPYVGLDGHPIILR